jgi:hypothetical protein
LAEQQLLAVDTAKTTTKTSKTMHGINEIKKQNAQAKANYDNSRQGTFCVLQNGNILLRSGAQSKTIESKEEAAEFLDQVRGRTSGFVRGVVQGHFPQQDLEQQFEDSRNGTYSVLDDGSILIRNGLTARTNDDKQSVAEFLAKVLDRPTEFVRGVVKSYFEPATA